MAGFCSQCGVPRKPEARFCFGCGTPFSAPVAAAPAPAVAIPAPVPPPSKLPPLPVCKLPPPPPPPVALSSPPFAASGPAPVPGVLSPPAAGAPVGPRVELPPSGEPWEFQKNLLPHADALAKTVNGVLAPTQAPGRIAERLVRGVLLDSRAFRQAAEDSAWTGEAGVALAVTSLIGCSALLASSPMIWIGAALIGLAGQGVAILACSVLSGPVLGVKLEPATALRTLACAAGAGALNFLPGVGQIIQIWTLICGVAALRAVTGAETAKAALLLILSGITGLVLVAPLAAGMIWAILR